MIQGSYGTTRTLVVTSSVVRFSVKYHRTPEFYFRNHFSIKSKVIGIAACVIGLAYGVNGGGGINPARDLGPRLFALCMYGSEAISGANYFFWIPLIAPLVGGVVAAFTYLFFISAHHEPEPEKPQRNDYVPVQVECEFSDIQWIPQIRHFKNFFQ